MKRVLYIVILFISFNIFPQAENKSEIMYLDFFNKKTSKEKAVFYVLKKEYKKDILLYQKYAVSKLDTIILIEKYFYDKKENKQGKYISYYIDGKNKSVGFYKDDLKIGQWKFYKKTPQTSKDTLNTNTYYFKLETYNNDVKDGVFKEFYNSGKLRGEGNYKNNNFFGQCKWYFDNGQLSSDELYDEKGKLKEIKQWNENGTVYKGKMKPLKGPIANKKLFSKKMSRYITSRFNSNIFKMYRNKRGKIYTRFTVNKQGKIERIKIISNLPKVYGDEVKRLLLNFPVQGSPFYHNQPINVRFTVPVIFRMRSNISTKTTIIKRRH